MVCVCIDNIFEGIDPSLTIDINSYGVIYFSKEHDNDEK